MKERIIVVEGRHDEAILKQIDPRLKTVSVGGSSIDKKVLAFLRSIQETYEIVLFLDPDYAGEHIRSKLSEEIKVVSHAFLDKEQAFSKNKKKIGIEHASFDDIKKALNHTVSKKENISNEITYTFLHDLGIIGKQDSKIIRQKIAKHFRVGHVNGKKLVQRLNWLGVKKEEIIEVLNGY